MTDGNTFLTALVEFFTTLFTLFNLLGLLFG